jgi:hypothetical protein
MNSVKVTKKSSRLQKLLALFLDRSNAIGVEAIETGRIGRHLFVGNHWKLEQKNFLYLKLNLRA